MLGASGSDDFNPVLPLLIWLIFTSTEEQVFMQSISLAVAGTDTAQGKMFLEKLQDRENIEISDFYPLEKAPDDYDAVKFRKKNYIKGRLDDFDFSRVTVAVFFCSSKNAREPMLKALDAGCKVIDATRGERARDDARLIIPEINGCDAADPAYPYLVSPSPAVISAALAIYEIYNEFGIEYLNITAMEPVSAAGHEGVKELAGQAAQLLNGRPPVMKNFPAQVAFNVIPSEVSGDEEQYSDYEMTQIRDIGSFIPGASGRITFNSYTVSVFYGYSCHLTFRTSVSVSLPELKYRLSSGLLNEYAESATVTPVTHGIDRDRQIISRVRESTGAAGEFSMFAVFDNLLAGSVQNCIKILENMTNEW